MGYYHETPLADKLYIGSAKVFIADYQSDYLTAIWERLGVLSALGMEPNTEVVTPESTNGKHSKKVTKQEETINLTLQEINPDILNKLCGGLKTIEIVTGTLVSGATQDLAANSTVAGKFYVISKQNGNKSLISVTTIVKDPTGTPVTLTAGTDYDVVKNDRDESGIIFKTSIAYDPTKLMRITYSYTPAAQKIIKEGGKSAITPKMLKIAHEEDDGRKFTVIYYKVEYSSGGGIALKKDGGAELIDAPVTLVASQDTTRSAGDQLRRTIFE